MIQWKYKLTSRKFWALVAALVVSVMTAFGAGAEQVERVTGVLMACGACVAYMLAEASVDRAALEDDLDFAEDDEEGIQ